MTTIRNPELDGTWRLTQRLGAYYIFQRCGDNFGWGWLEYRIPVDRFWGTRHKGDH